MTRLLPRLLFAAVLAVAARALAAEWLQASAPRAWSFPGDHGAHPEYRTEWWYFTGTLSDTHGLRYGYQLTFFRQGIRTNPAQPANPWSVRDLYLAHFAVTDVAAGRFRYADRSSRAGPGLAGARTGAMDVWLFDWSARLDERTIRLTARTKEIEIDLELEPRKPVVLHGDRGFSRKGPKPGQASHYASLTGLATRGRLRSGPGWVEVNGQSWFDQEFGSNQLASDQKGWDWLSLRLSDGRELMLYAIRRVDGTVEPSSSGTLVEADGRSRHLPLSAFHFEVLDRWKSPRTGALYPSRWRVAVPSAGIEVELAPWLADQELATEASTGVVYWEGAVGGRGRSATGPVTAEGYAELTGYGGSLGGLF